MPSLLHRFRQLYPDEAYRQFEPIDARSDSTEAWLLAIKAAEEIGPDINMLDPKALLASCRGYSVGALKQQACIATLSADVATVYFFNRIDCHMSEAAAAHLMDLEIDALFRHLHWYTMSYTVRCLLWPFVFWMHTHSPDALVAEYLRRGLDPAYYVLQDILRKIKN